MTTTPSETSPATNSGAGHPGPTAWVRWWVACLLALCFLSHLPILSAGFVWDDFTLVRDNAAGRDPANLARFFVNDLGRFNAVPRDMGFYRPLQSVSFYIDHLLFGLRPFGYHLGNLLLHALATLVVLGLGRRLGLSMAGAGLAAAVFAVLPGKSEEVFLIANRGGLMAAVFALGSLGAHTAGVKSDRKGARAASLALFLLGLLSKETAIVVPALIVMTTLFFHRQTWRTGGLGVRWHLVGAGHWLVAGAYLIWRFGILGIGKTGLFPAGGPVQVIWNIPRIVINYLRLLVVPVGLTPEHPFDFAPALGSAGAAAAWIALAALTTLMVFAGRKIPVAGYGALFFAVCLAPVLNLVPLYRPFSEHYLYLPAAGLCLAVGALVARLAGKDRARAPVWIAAGAVVLFYGAVNFALATHWQDECKLWQRAYRVAPTSRATNNLGTCLYERGEPDRANALFKQSLAADPTNYKTAFNLARIAMDRRDWPAAGKWLEYALKLKPDYLRAVVAAGVVGYGSGKTPNEVEIWLRKLSPRWPEAFAGYRHAAQKQNDAKALTRLDAYLAGGAQDS